MAKINMTSLDVLTDEVYGKEGTPRRDAMEKQLKEVKKAAKADTPKKSCAKKSTKK